MTSLTLELISLVLLTLTTVGLAQNLGDVRRSTFFVANENQWEGEFAFRVEVRGAVCYVTSSGLTLDFRESALPPTSVGGIKGGRFFAEQGLQTLPQSVRGHVLKMNFVAANPTPELIGQDKLASYSNYFLGRDSCRWRSFVGHYQRVVAKEVWPGIDVEFGLRRKGSRRSPA